MLRQEKILVGKSQAKNERARIQSPGRQSRHGVKHRKNCISWGRAGGLYYREIDFVKEPSCSDSDSGSGSLGGKVRS